MQYLVYFLLEADKRIKIGVFGTQATSAAGFYQERFKAQEFEKFVVIEDSELTMTFSPLDGIFVSIYCSTQTCYNCMITNSSEFSPFAYWNWWFAVI